jgi:plastocyanin
MIFSATLLSLAALPVARSVIIPVTVGGPGGIVGYSPNFVTANPGDVVVFTFEQKNHTVTQSSFATPCEALPGGFDSGFIPVLATQTSDFQNATYTVTDTNPVWIYCRQTGHCQLGMVFAINPGTQFPAFQAAAEASGGTTTSAGPPAVVTVTATVTEDSGSALTTTYGSYPGSAAPTSAVSTDHPVVVGGSALVYTPSNITAQPGDTVTFQFQQKNHTATQSSFAVPCRELALTSTSGQVGFDSGFMPVSANETTFPTYTIQINDTAPVWVYCRQTGHCGEGMVFSVNAIATGPNNFAAFQASAKQQNGSATSPSSAPASTSTGSSGGASTQSISYGAGTVLALVSAVFGLLF